MDDIGAVKDQIIDQGVGLAVSTEQEPTTFYLQGPQRVASAHNQIIEICWLKHSEPDWLGN